MAHQPRPETEGKILSEPVATRLLDRASQLDAALKSGASVANLRSAAVEAGISLDAFDAALAELDIQTIPLVRRRARWQKVIAFGLVGALAAMMLAVAMFVLPVMTAAPVSEEAFLLRCLSPSQATELLKPVTNDPNTAVIFTSRAPGVLTVRGNKEQLRTVRGLLDKYEASASAACPVAPAPNPK